MFLPSVAPYLWVVGAGGTIVSPNRAYISTVCGLPLWAQVTQRALDAGCKGVGNRVWSSSRGNGCGTVAAFVIAEGTNEPTSMPGSPAFQRKYLPVGKHGAISG